MRRAKRSAFKIVLLLAKAQLLRLYLQFLLAVDAAVFAVRAQLKDLVALLFNAGDAARVLAAYNVHQTLGGLGLLLADSLAVLNNGHADEIGRASCRERV